MNKTDEFEFEPTPAILLRYEGDWNQALNDYYQRHPEQRGRINLILLPVGGRFKLDRS
jgi:hypothetical protein